MSIERERGMESIGVNPVQRAQQEPTPTGDRLVMGPFGVEGREDLFGGRASVSRLSQPPLKGEFGMAGSGIANFDGDQIIVEGEEMFEPGDLCG